MSEGSTGQIPTNLRLLKVMEYIAQEGTPVAPSRLGAALDLPKPTVYRLLATAEEEGFVQRDIDGRSFGLGKRLRKLAANTLSSQRVRTERLLVLQSLSDKVGETCNLAAPGRYGMVYLDRVETLWPLRIQLPVGTQVPFHCTASGKMYLSSLRPEKLQRLLSMLPLEQMTEKTTTDVDKLVAEMAMIRQRGYSTDNEEFMDDMAAVAVPICDDQGRLLTTLSLHAPIQRMTVDALSSSLDVLKQAARQLEDLLD